MLPDASLIRLALAAKCPQCRKGDIFRPGFLSLDMYDRCPSCGLDLAKNDNGDGPAVFLIFVLGFLLVPLALVVEFTIGPPLWAQAVLWLVIGLGMTLGMLRPLKAYILALEFKHRPNTWKE